MAPGSTYVCGTPAWLRDPRMCVAHQHGSGSHTCVSGDAWLHALPWVDHSLKTWLSPTISHKGDLHCVLIINRVAAGALPPPTEKPGTADTGRARVLALVDAVAYLFGDWLHGGY